MIGLLDVDRQHRVILIARILSFDQRVVSQTADEFRDAVADARPRIVDCAVP